MPVDHEPSLTTVGEHGPELFIPTVNGRIIPVECPTDDAGEDSE